MEEYEELLLTPEEQKEFYGEELQEMIKLFSVQSKSGAEYRMVSYIISYCNKNKLSYKRDKNNNILITKGKLKKDEFYPCIVAHMDTVHNFVEKYSVQTYCTKEGLQLYAQGLKSKPFSKFAEYKNVKPVIDFTGIGGDDKCGIYLAFKMLESFDKLKVIFTVEEEVGGAKGSNSIDKEWVKNVGYFIQGDRRGNSDLVTSINSGLISKEFENIILPIAKEYKYREVGGMFTDIDVLSKRFSLSAINLSVGYYKPHSDNEYVIYEDLLHAISFVKELVKNLGNKKYEHKRKEFGGFNRFSWNKTGIYGTDDYRDYYNSLDEDFNYTSYYDDDCMCTSQLIDLDCKLCNPVLMSSAEWCPYCGSSLLVRKSSVYCSVCNKHFKE